MTIDLANSIKTANKFGDDIQSLVVARGNFPSDDRNTLLMGQWSLTFDLHRGTICLLHNKLYGGAFALIRPTVESVIRAHIAICGSDEDIEKLRTDQYKTNFSTVGQQIDTYFGLKGYLTAFLGRSKNWLHSFTHGGTYQLARRYSGTDLTANYSDADILRVIALSVDGVFMVNNIATRYLKFEEEWKRTNELYLEWSTFVGPQIKIAMQIGKAPS